MVPDEEPLTSGGGEMRQEGEEEMEKQCLLQSKIKGIMPTALSLDLFHLLLPKLVFAEESVTHSLIKNADAKLQLLQLPYLPFNLLV